MKKTLLWSLVPWLVVIMVFFTCGLAQAEVKGLILGAGGWNQATWKNGLGYSPDGSMKDDALCWQVEGQVRVDRWLPWDLQPTLAGFYQGRAYDFSTVNSPIQKSTPVFYGAMIGVTKEFKLLNAYLVGGVACYEINLHMVEKRGDEFIDHGDVSGGIVPIIELGMYRMFPLDYNMAIGPFIGVQYYPMNPGFHRCRNFDMGHFMIMGGLAIELGF
jgi:hypothetical protein